MLQWQVKEEGMEEVGTFNWPYMIYKGIKHELEETEIPNYSSTSQYLHCLEWLKTLKIPRSCKIKQVQIEELYYEVKNNYNLNNHQQSSTGGVSQACCESAGGKVRHHKVKRTAPGPKKNQGFGKKPKGRKHTCAHPEHSPHTSVVIHRNTPYRVVFLGVELDCCRGCFTRHGGQKTKQVI